MIAQASSAGRFVGGPGADHEDAELGFGLCLPFAATAVLDALSRMLGRMQSRRSLMCGADSESVCLFTVVGTAQLSWECLNQLHFTLTIAGVGDGQPSS